MAGDGNRTRAAQKYAARVSDAGGNEEASLWHAGLRQYVVLGDEDFVACMQALASTEQRSAGYVLKAQRKLLGTLQDCLRANSGSRVRHHDDRDGQRVAAVGVAHQPIDRCGGNGRPDEGGKRQDPKAPLEAPTNSPG